MLSAFVSILTLDLADVVEGVADAVAAGIEIAQILEDIEVSRHFWCYVFCPSPMVEMKMYKCINSCCRHTYLANFPTEPKTAQHNIMYIRGYHLTHAVGTNSTFFVFFNF
jgi:hypothetical protein